MRRASARPGRRSRSAVPRITVSKLFEVMRDAAGELAQRLHFSAPGADLSSARARSSISRSSALLASASAAARCDKATFGAVQRRLPQRHHGDHQPGHQHQQHDDRIT